MCCRGEQGGLVGGGEAISIHAKAQARNDLVQGACFLVSRDK